MSKRCDKTVEAKIKSLRKLPRQFFNIKFRKVRFRWVFPVIGLVSLIWFLVRVIPKPNRAAYPCQRAAFPLASGFVIWLIGALASILFFRKAKHCFARSRHVVGIMLVSVSIGAIWLALNSVHKKKAFADDPIPNSPIGLAKGLHPGRVVWIHDPEATNWEGPGTGDGFPWQPDHTNQHYVDDMMSQA